MARASAGSRATAVKPRAGRPSAGSRTTPVKASPTAIAALREADPVMARLIDEHVTVVRRDLKRERPGDAYGALLRSIVGQQLSTKAASTIYGRMIDIFGGHAPTPKQLLAADPEEIRAAGLSRPKIAYLRDLAQHVEDGTLELDRLDQLPDDEVSAQLTAIKGLGQWTADMFLMFHLRRPDVLPVGDQGIRRAVKVQYRMRKLPDPKRLEKVARPWRPHRTLACLFLWSSLDNVPA
jgi:DNA-3-methyladenine glycosylase II